VVIYELRRTKGYVVMGEAAGRLHVSPSSVTNMLKILQRKGYIEYERYKGITLTERGEQVAKHVLRKHYLLLEFLNILGIKGNEAYRDAHQMEHCLHGTTIERLEKFVHMIKANPRILDEWKQHQ